MRTALTATRISEAKCSPEKRQLLVWDATQPGLVLRVYPSGRKIFMLFYRVGTGRKAVQRWESLGDAAAISLKDARDAAKAKLGAVAKGDDTAGARKAAQRRERARLSAALESYEASLERRKVVQHKQVMSLLRRELLAPLGNVGLDELDRARLVDRVNAVEKSGRPGAARELRSRAGVFLGWAVDEGLIPGNPLAGWRQQRRTRAERLVQTGRALADEEIPIFWRAAEAQGWPFGPYLQALLLTGQRRTETALMHWEHVDLASSEWRIPPEITKAGRLHRVPLPEELVGIFGNLPRMTGSPYVFPGRHGKPLTGWSKRLRSVQALTRAANVPHWTLHDLRRTARSGLSALGVDAGIAELMLNHALSDDLQKVYDRHDAWSRRVEAAALWGRHVCRLIGKKQPGNVIALHL